MIDVKALSGKMVAYALVRDKNGKPKIDDPANLPYEIFVALTDEEIEDIYHGDLPPHLKARI